MALLNEWKLIARHSWAVRLSVIAAVLAGVDAAMQIFASIKPSPLLAAGAGVTSLAATAARFVRQDALHRGDGS